MSSGENHTHDARTLVTTGLTVVADRVLPGRPCQFACYYSPPAAGAAIWQGGQIEVGAGPTPGAGGVQHLARLLGRGRAMEAILGADDFSAEQAERYGWINRALPDADLDAFVARLARRIASFPAAAVRSAKRVLNELTLPGADAIRADARRFHQLVVSDAAQARTAALFAQGLQTRGPLELNLGDRLGTL